MSCGGEMKLSELLQQGLDTLDRHASRHDIGDNQINKLKKARDSARVLLRYVSSIEENIVLNVEEDTEYVPPDFEHMTLVEAIEQSELLGALHRASITIKSVDHFNSDLFRIAESLAASFRTFGNQLRAFRAARKGKEEGEWTFLTHGGEGFSDFLGFLKKNGIAEIERVLLKKDKKWSFFKPEWWKSSSDNQEFLVVFKVLDAHKNQFIHGDWMTAFIFDVMRTYLQRNKIRHEIFAKVAYSAPADIINSRSDFDIVILIGGTALVFECKTGKIDTENAADIVSKATEISKVLHRFVPDIAEFRFFTIFDDALNNEQSVRNFFADGMVEPKRIDEIRELVFDLFRAKGDTAKVA